MSEPHSTDEAAMPADAGTAAAPASAGALLRQARQAQGLHIAALAASIKVTPRKLEALESDRHEELLDATFVRALAQAVCRALKIDSEPVLARLPTSIGGGLEPMTMGLNAPLRPRPGGSRRDGGDWPRLSRPLLWGSLVLVAGAVLLYLLPAGLLRPHAVAPADAGASAPEPAASVPTLATEEPSVPVNMPPPAGVVTVPESAASGDVSPLASPPLATPLTAPQEQPASAPASAPVATAPAGTAPVSIRTSGEAWIEIRQAGGKVLLSRTVKAGEALDFDAVPPLQVKVGNTTVTELRFRGQAVPLSGAAGNVAKLELK